MGKSEKERERECVRVFVAEKEKEWASECVCVRERKRKRGACVVEERRIFSDKEITFTKVTHSLSRKILVTSSIFLAKLPLISLGIENVEQYNGGSFFTT